MNRTFVFSMFGMALTIDHHWQCNWRVAWTSSCICTNKRRTLRATIVTIFSHTRRDFQFLSNVTNVTRFLDCFYLEIATNSNSKFRKVVWQHTECMAGSIIRIVLDKCALAENNWKFSSAKHLSTRRFDDNLVRHWQRSIKDCTQAWQRGKLTLRAELINPYVVDDRASCCIIIWCCKPAT